MTNDVRQRVFFAARPDLQAFKTLQNQLPSLKLSQSRRLRWLPASNWHLTLRFIGEVPEQLGSELQTLLPKVAAQHAPFRMVFTALALFPSDQHPRVLAATADACVVSRALVTDLEILCRRVGLPAELRPWRPHMTLARVRGGQPFSFVAKKLSIDMQVTTICLMESIETAGRRVYVPLSETPLTSARL